MTNPRVAIARVAARYLGVREVTSNRSPELATFWPYTSYPNGMADRAPWCAAFVCACTAIASAETPDLDLAHRPTSASCSGLLEWAREPKNGCLVFGPHDPKYRPLAGDIVNFLPHLSHVGIVAEDYDNAGFISTIEGNTNGEGSREGDGVYRKRRAISFPGFFIRVPAKGERLR